MGFVVMPPYVYHSVCNVILDEDGSI